MTQKKFMYMHVDMYVYTGLQMCDYNIVEVSQMTEQARAWKLGLPSNLCSHLARGHI